MVQENFIRFQRKHRTCHSRTNTVFIGQTEKNRPSVYCRIFSTHQLRVRDAHNLIWVLCGADQIALVISTRFEEDIKWGRNCEKTIGRTKRWSIDDEDAGKHRTELQNFRHFYNVQASGETSPNSKLFNLILSKITRMWRKIVRKLHPRKKIWQQGPLKVKRKLIRAGTGVGIIIVHSIIIIW